MEKKNTLKEWVEGFIVKYIEEYPDRNFGPKIWRTPLVGYADANHPYIRRLPEIVMPEHSLPEDFLEDSRIIISYFVPFTKELAQTNVQVAGNAASKEWSEAYSYTNHMMGELNEQLAEELRSMGYRAAVPKWETNRTLLKSNWSQRHIAYVAGLGTFGINNMLISGKGCCGRYNSIVTDIPVEADVPLEEENCLYKSRGICKKCIRNCFSGALTVEGFDRRKCRETCSKNPEGVCGKCDTNIPCAFTAPGK